VTEPAPVSETAPSAAGESPSRASLILLIVAAALFIIALLIGIQVIGVLFAIISPPPPPLPDDRNERLHSSADYGVDDWTFTTSMTPCDVIRLVEDAGGVCQISPVECEAPGDAFAESGSAMVARCEGTLNFSIFSQSYETVISRRGDSEAGSELRVIREIYWIGSAPPVDINTTFQEQSGQ
jgi:hypothetical protein